MVDGVVVVTVVGGLGLMSMHRNRQRIEVQRHAPPPMSSGRLESPRRALEDRASQPIALVLGRERVGQARQGRLRRQVLRLRRIARRLGSLGALRRHQGRYPLSVGNREPERRLLAQGVGVVEIAIPESQQQHHRSHQLRQGVGGQLRLASVGEMVREILRQAKPLEHLAQGDDASIRSQVTGPRLDTHRAVELEREQRKVFTQDAPPREAGWSFDNPFLPLWARCVLSLSTSARM